ncbi:MAG: hypothetical protein V3W14_01900 [Candidatus Neomarinimicrobiota bacterium]
MKLTHQISILLALMVSFALVGCGRKSPTQSSRIKSALRAGWNEFDDGNMEAALEEFLEAYSLDSTRAQSQVAVAWARLMIPGTDPATVIAVIDSNATDDEDWQNDAWCALAVAHLILNEHQEADSAAFKVLAADSAYIFVNRPSVDWNDLLLIRGQALFFMAEYDSAWTVLTSLVVGTIYESIDPTNLNTWVFWDVDRYKTYNMFAEILAKVISALVETHRL